MISEIFSTSFLFSIAVIIIAVGGLFAYFNYRLSEHNHKMQAMMGLVSTMAEEMQYFRSKIHNNPVLNDTNTSNSHIVPNFLGGAIKEDELIEVSDSEIDEEDVEEDDEDDEDVDVDEDDVSLDLEEDDNLDEDLEEDDDSEASDLNVEDLEDDDNSVKIITINIDLGGDNDTPIESENIGETETADSIDLNLSNLEDAEDLDLDLSLKSISIDTTVSTNKEKEDYKKMSLNKLRELVSEKGLVKDSSKLKKNDLLKMLGAE
jgi:hypothetical protein